MSVKKSSVNILKSDIASLKAEAKDVEEKMNKAYALQKELEVRA
jgi:hypothetical protein